MSYTVFRDLMDSTAQQRRTFFKLLFGETPGVVNLAFKLVDQNKMLTSSFEWPVQLEELLSHIDTQSQQLVHAYFCPNLYGQGGNRHKEYVSTCTNVWADLDTCDPRHLLIRPSILVQSSPGRYQAYWLLEEPVSPTVAENIALRIAYYHAEQGADKSGWDLSQLLRIPYTPNLKYGNPAEAPIVSILHAEKTLFRPKDFDIYPPVESIKFVNEPAPAQVLLQESAEDIIERSGMSMNPLFERLFSEEPTGEWSGPLWNLIRMCAEGGLSREEAFVIANASRCNKYARDGRPETDLWHDVNRAFVKRIEVMNLAPTPTATIPELLTKDEIRTVQATNNETFVERYIRWASGLTDAAPQYHQSGAFIILSSILAGNVRLPTSFGIISPNLWFMILGDTTLTRKTTAMKLAMNLLYDVDDRALLATDGSVEGILVGMRDRPRQPSIFLRDEFAGLLDAIAHKDYMAGFSDQLTKLYDGDGLRRLLRKEVIDIKDPVFIMYVGGPKMKTQTLITEDLVTSGFIPRFVIISAEPDISRIRPLGPPSISKIEEREWIKNELIDLHNHYVAERSVTKNGKTVGRVRPEFNVVLTPEAWKRYNDYEFLMTKTALDTGLEYLTPVHDRLAKSTLKAAILIAASRQRNGDNIVTVEVNDLIHAIYYAREWREFGSEIVNGIGKSYDERILDRIYGFVRNAPNGVTRAEIMNMYHLDTKRADLLLKTMEQRRMILLKRDNNGHSRYTA